MSNNQYQPVSFTHPGITLRQKLIEMGIGPKEFALRTGKPEKTISAILNCNSSITPDMAVQFENVLQIPARFWNNYQQKYNETIARQKSRQAISDAADWARKFPYAAMANLNWVSKTRNIEEKAENLLKFFGFSSHKIWESFYYEEKLKVAFRISLKHTKEAPAISAWLRRGDILSQYIDVPEYNSGTFKDALLKIKCIMAKHPQDFFNQLKELCRNAGVKVVYTPCLPKAPINGCTRWINDTPLIQLSGRYRRNDSFWFTFFHEAGHILMHGKKDIFLEYDYYSDKDEKKEKEADDFAGHWLLTEKEEAEIISKEIIEDEEIFNFARKFNTHPAIIIGRLQHKKLIDYSVGRKFLMPVNFDENQTNDQ